MYRGRYEALDRTPKSGKKRRLISPANSDFSGFGEDAKRSRKRKVRKVVVEENSEANEDEITRKVNKIVEEDKYEDGSESENESEDDDESESVDNDESDSDYVHESVD